MISNLSFDSNLFNYPVGKATIGEDWDEQQFIEAARAYQLVYLFSETVLEIFDQTIQLVDTKVTFQKSLKLLEKPDAIQSYGSSVLENEIAELAYLSAVSSRFKIDPRLRSDEFRKLYKRWITKAFENKELLVAPQKSGMVSFSVEKELGKIELIAVAEKHQGQGLGKKLVQAAEYAAFQNGAKSMQIPTQEKNIPACRLYESLGYHLVEKVFVYHYWNG